jgi:uncharacterized protein (DUF3820 family)
MTREAAGKTLINVGHHRGRRVVEVAAEKFGKQYLRWLKCQRWCPGLVREAVDTYLRAKVKEVTRAQMENAGMDRASGGYAVNPDRCSAQSFVMPFGKYRGKTLGRIGSAADGLDYLAWARRTGAAEGQARRAIVAYLKHRELRSTRMDEGATPSHPRDWGDSPPF